MPGFNINNSDNTDRMPPATVETFREHRYVIENFMNMTVNNSSNQHFLFVKDVTMPAKVLKTLSIATVATTYNFASQASYSDLKLSFYTSNKGFIEALVDLEKQIHTLDDGIKDFDDYKKEIKILWFKDGGGYDSSLSKVRFTCGGCVITNVSWGQVSYGSSAIKLVDLTVKIDTLEVDPNASIGGA